MAGKRRDPAERPVEFGRGRTKLLNQDPDKHYVLVPPTPRYVMSEYLAMGYEVETAENGGVKINGIRTAEGQPLEYEDCVLMSIPKRANPMDPDAPSKERIDQVGPYGDTGWQLTQKIEDRIINKKSTQEDLMRGIKGGRGYVDFESDTKPLTSL